MLLTNCFNQLVINEIEIKNISEYEMQSICNLKIIRKHYDQYNYKRILSRGQLGERTIIRAIIRKHYQYENLKKHNNKNNSKKALYRDNLDKAIYYKKNYRKTILSGHLQERNIIRTIIIKHGNKTIIKSTGKRTMKRKNYYKDNYWKALLQGQL